jgi:hypothetical protein
MSAGFRMRLGVLDTINHPSAIVAAETYLGGSLGEVVANVCRVRHMQNDVATTRPAVDLCCGSKLIGSVITGYRKATGSPVSAAITAKNRT